MANMSVWHLSFPKDTNVLFFSKCTKLCVLLQACCMSKCWCKLCGNECISNLDLKSFVGSFLCLRHIYFLFISTLCQNLKMEMRVGLLIKITLLYLFFFVIVLWVKNCKPKRMK